MVKSPCQEETGDGPGLFHEAVLSDPFFILHDPTLAMDTVYKKSARIPLALFTHQKNPCILFISVDWSDTFENIFVQ